MPELTTLTFPILERTYLASSFCGRATIWKMTDVEQTKRLHFPNANVHFAVFSHGDVWPSRRQLLVGLVALVVPPLQTGAPSQRLPEPPRFKRSAAEVHGGGGKRFVKTSVNPRAFIRLRRSVIATRSSYSHVSQYVFLDAIKLWYADGHSTIQFSSICHQGLLFSHKSCLFEANQGKHWWLTFISRLLSANVDEVQSFFFPLHSSSFLPHRVSFMEACIQFNVWTNEETPSCRSILLQCSQRAQYYVIMWEVSYFYLIIFTLLHDKQSKRNK